MKAMLLATRADMAESLNLPNRVVDMPSLIERIRTFVFDIGGRPTMALPPMDKASRARVHEVAEAFGLKSQSKGKGDNRYTTLIRTSRTGIKIKEKKISRIAGGNYGFTRPETRGKKGVPLPKHKEGDEVGKVGSLIVMLFLNQLLTLLRRLHQRLVERILGLKCCHLWDGLRAQALVFPVV